MPSSSPPPGLADHTPSNISSPLSEVDDKDGDAEDMDLDLQNNTSSSLSNINLDEDDNEVDGPASRSLSDAENDDDGSSLSHVDINDSEAETERLYDTPPKTNNILDVPSRTPETRRRNSILARDRTFEPSPSKLRHQSRAALTSIPNVEEEDSASGDDAEVDEADDDNASEASSESDHKPTNRRRPLDRATSPVKQSSDAQAKEKDTATQETGDGSGSDLRKRKRSPDAELSESDQPLGKRIGSVAAKDLNHNGDTPAADEDGEITTNPHSGEQSDAENDNDAPTKNGDQAPNPSANAAGEILRRKSKRNNGKKRKDPDETGTDEEPAEEGADELGTGTADDEAVEHGDDDPAEPDIDEEAEAAHKNEEELEKKRIAMEQLQSAEKQFAGFRDQLYQQRLSQLEEEEAMLKGDNPTHPEYLAMIKCLQERRDTKIRIADAEHRLNCESRNRWAVARRAQIHSQFFQNVRQSREDTLEFLGDRWYQIQQQRRKHANTIPDFGIRFPGAVAQRTKDAVAYNKEVSILSGVAKHHGFPAAPMMKGATSTECEDDFEEIGLSLQRAGQNPLSQASAAAAFVDLSGASYTHAHAIGAAGQQYLADTPWANPKHPSHLLQRQHALQEPRNNSPLAGPSNRRQTGAPAVTNGDSISKSHHAPEHPAPKHLKAIPEPSGKQREAVI